MALNIIKNAKVRNTDELHTIKNGVVRPVSELWVMTSDGLRLIWQAISSCFGAGYWQSPRPWKGSDGWKRNK